jgi:microcystin-dependent protein
MSVQDYSPTPSANTEISGINIGEGCNASNINDAIRQMMADIASMLTGGQLEPVGTVKDYAGSTAPTGYLMCDGSAVSRSTYSGLFAVISTTFGAGDGSLTFNLPDCRGRGRIGAGTGAGLTARALGATGGEETHTLTVSEVPALSASVSGTTSAGGGHTHTLTDPGHTHTLALKDHSGAGPNAAYGSGSSGSATTDSAQTGISIASTADHSHSFSATAATNGGGGAHNNMQPFIALNAIIKV